VKFYAGKPLLSAAVHKSCVECFNRTSFCIWVQETQILAVEAVFSEVTIILPLLYGPTVLVFLNRKNKFLKRFSGPLRVLIEQSRD